MFAGPLVCIELLGQNVLLLGSHQVAVDLLDRRSRIYSDRPRMIVASEILTGGMVIVLSQFGEM